MLGQVVTLSRKHGRRDVQTLIQYGSVVQFKLISTLALMYRHVCCCDRGGGGAAGPVRLPEDCQTFSLQNVRHIVIQGNNMVT